MTVRNLLVELLVEELPPKALKKLGEAFACGLLEGLRVQGLTSEDSAVTSYATPRRLAAHITQLASQAADKPISQKLMPVVVGLDASGQATPALVKKLTAMGAEAVEVADLKRQHDGKTDMLFLDVVATGATLVQGLQKALDETLAALPIPKVMSYQLQDGWTSVNFVRPAHGLLALHGDEVVSVSLLGIESSNLTQGHRFEASRQPIMVQDADSYEAQLAAEGAVIASFSKRRQEIATQLDRVATEQGLTVIEDDALLDEVTALVENPNVLLGQFETRFLDVPQECLILTMKANQKYFPLMDAQGKLSNKFLLVSNICPADPSAVINGNERVVRPRLADAKFFFDQDRKKSLESRIVHLDKVVYHNKLGTQGERVQRVCTLANRIGQQLGGDQLASVAQQAALLAKADLLTDMVAEFPELQGVMGRYYALNDGLSEQIALAIEDHYKPRFAGDDLPRNPVGIVVALADKLETLSGLFGIGEKPSGDKDPFALRRHALGMIRMLIERDLPLDLDALLAIGEHCWSQQDSQQPTPAFATDATTQLAEFIYDRLAGHLREQKATPQEIDAVLALRPQRLAQIAERLAAVRVFSALPEAESLAAANKRVGNILKKAQYELNASVDVALLKQPAEKALYQALSEIGPQADAAFERGDYTASLQVLAALKSPIDKFFDGVMVNDDDAVLRNNRLVLLATLHQSMNRVADLSRLVTFA